MVWRPNGLRKREHFDEDDSVDRVHVVDIDFARVRFERVVEMLVHEREKIGLLHRDDVVRVDRLGGIDAPQLFVERERLLGRNELFLGDFGEAALEVSLEREPNGERQEVAERQRRFVDGPAERASHALGDRRLRRFEASERAVESVARDLVLVSEIALDLAEDSRRNASVLRHRSYGSAPNPHDYESSMRRAVLPKAKMARTNGRRRPLRALSSTRQPPTNHSERATTREHRTHRAATEKSRASARAKGS